MQAEPWRSIRLGDVASIKHGWPFKSEYFSEELTGRPIVVAIGNFEYTGGFRFESTTVKEYRGEYPQEYELTPRDILVVMTCQTPGGEILGIPARVPDDGRVYLHNQRIGKVVITRPDLVDADFLYWVFLWKELNQELVASSSGTKIVHTAPSRIGAFRFDLPPLDEQRAIARLLWALEHKRELNRRMSRTLGATVAALFRSWFVEFDAVVAKAQGRRAPGVSAVVHEVMPSHLAKSNVEPIIPYGWSVGTVQDLAHFVNGRNFTTGASGNTRLVIRIAELNGGPSGSTVYSDSPASPENIASPGDLLFSWSGSLGVYRWYRDEALVNQHIFKVVCETFPQWFVHQHLELALPFFQEIAAGKATTMGHIKRQHLAQVRIVLPPTDVLRAASAIFRPMYDRALVVERESLSLAATRDILLPQLLSGSLRLRTAEKLVEATV